MPQHTEKGPWMRAFAWKFQWRQDRRGGVTWLEVKHLFAAVSVKYQKKIKVLTGEPVAELFDVSKSVLDTFCATFFASPLDRVDVLHLL